MSFNIIENSEHCLTLLRKMLEALLTEREFNEVWIEDRFPQIDKGSHTESIIWMAINITNTTINDFHSV